MNSKNTRVAIIIPSKNRPEFIIRQLEYYASVQSRHPIYIGDASSAENFKKIQDCAQSLKNSLEISLEHLPQLTLGQTKYRLFSQAREKYACYIGDDDFQIPAGLAQCAEFLETHPDSASAHGYAVAIRIEGNSAFGKIKKIKDYPQPEVRSETPSQRMFDYFSNYYVPIFSVVRREIMREAWSHTDAICDKALTAEMLPCALCIIPGKSKLVDCLSFVRQIHDSHYELLDFYDWFLQESWLHDFRAFQDIIFQEIQKRENISREKIQALFKQSFWKYLGFWSDLEYREKYPAREKNQRSVREAIKKIPVAVEIYKILKPFIQHKKYLHAEVANPQSPYYGDFQAILRICQKER